MRQADETLVLNVVAVTGGAAINATATTVTITITDDGDISAPGAPSPPVVVRVTGGMIELSAGGIDPVATGGANQTIVARAVWRLLDTGDMVPLASYAVTALQAASTYQFVATVSNERFTSAVSGTRTVATTRVTPPSAPRGVVLTHRTGGMVQLGWVGPEDSGGEAVTGYTVRVHSVDSGGEVRRGHKHARTCKHAHVCTCAPRKRSAARVV